jgi:hypothetical protein
MGSLTQGDARERSVDSLRGAMRQQSPYAGAAEEILGQAVGDPAAFAQLKTTFAGRLDISEKVLSQQHLNKARNWLKHWDQHMDDEKICLELDEEAIQYIVRNRAKDLGSGIGWIRTGATCWHDRTGGSPAAARH